MLDSKTDVKYMTVDEYYDDAFNIDTAEVFRFYGLDATTINKLNRVSHSGIADKENSAIEGGDNADNGGLYGYEFSKGLHYITYDDKLELMRFTLPLRTKSDMLESLLSQVNFGADASVDAGNSADREAIFNNLKHGPSGSDSSADSITATPDPAFIQQLLQRYYSNYNKNIPVILIHSIMLGILRSPHLSFEDKINHFKTLELLAIVTFFNFRSNLKKYLRLKKIKVELVDLVINESKRINGGSVKTLQWALWKIVSVHHEKDYKEELDRWKVELEFMKRERKGFWSPECNGSWNP
ncbi:unnamed protein product [Ambrosiozyma monospora]|uniref:Unnamed protein product n=1 Tax=Ambrosiozyma monospora TaxID=43982 RepID=A0ACB5UCK3_AMBMO|nr:unnamed protein product [Ambrosiozyma monospora]